MSRYKIATKTDILRYKIAKEVFGEVEDCDGVRDIPSWEIFEKCLEQNKQIRSLEEQLKNFKPNEIYFIGGKAMLSEEELKNKDFLEVKKMNVKDIIDEYISKRGGFIDLTFATREEAEKRLAELKGEGK